MFRSLLDAGTKALGAHRFSLVNVLPVALLALLFGALIRVGAYSGSTPVEWQKAIPSGISAVAASAVFAFLIFVLSVLLRPFQVALVRLLEGYWVSRIGTLAARFAVAHHRRVMLTASHDYSTRNVPEASSSDAESVVRRERQLSRVLARADRANSRLQQYPRLNRLLPTMLGNILRAGEDKAGVRYGLDAMTVYPRLYPNLSPRLDAAMSRQLDLIDTTAAITVSMAVATVVSFPLIFVRGWTFALVPAVTLIIALVSYRGAKAAAKGHAVLLATAIDVHRFDLLRALHFPLPATVRDEYVFNQNLTKFLASGHAGAENEALDILGGSQRYKH